MDAIAELVGRDSVTVLVTDSGLGGLAVVADLERRARATGAWRALDLVFANALPEAGRGYNTMGSAAEKARVFGNALAGMAARFRPDVVLVACNTLSVLIPQVGVAVGCPLLGIVEPGVALLEQQLRDQPASTAVVFGSETTIAAGAHLAQLAARGIPPRQLVAQACPGLASAIERDAGSDEVAAMIDRFAAAAMARLERPGGAVVAGLCCTHYGYCADRFVAALRAHGAGAVTVADPTTRMAGALILPGRAGSGTADVSVRVVSRALISDAEVRSIAALVEPVSAPTAAALRAWEHDRGLFRLAGDGAAAVTAAGAAPAS